MLLIHTDPPSLFPSLCSEAEVHFKMAEYLQFTKEQEEMASALSHANK